MPAILIVDDNASNLDTIESIFAHEDLDLFYASSGLHALDLLETLAIDTILLDVMMPEMNGFEVCHYFRQQESLKTIPPGMVFRNKGSIHLNSLETIHPDVEFNNQGYVDLRSLMGDGLIEGIDPKTLLNRMIKRGIFL